MGLFKETGQLLGGGNRDHLQLQEGLQPSWFHVVLNFWSILRLHLQRGTQADAPF